MRRLALTLLLSLSSVADTRAASQDMRPLVEMTISKSWDFPPDGQYIRIAIFRNGLLHYEDTKSWDRSLCPTAHVLALGYGSPSQVEGLDAALAKARIAELEGGCSVPRSDSDFASYRISWISRRGDQSNDIQFTGGSTTFPPPPPPPPACDRKVLRARDAVLGYARVTMALRRTLTASGSACYPEN